MLSERDAKKLEIDYATLELQKEPAVGLGGTSPIYRIKRECKLTFVDSERKPYLVTLSEFDVTKVEIEDQRTRQLVFNLIPSLIGMDILEDFKVVATRDMAYLER